MPLSITRVIVISSNMIWLLEHGELVGFADEANHYYPYLYDEVEDRRGKIEQVK